MSRRAKSVPDITPTDFHFPDTKRQREMLNDALVNIQTQGYQAFMNLIIAEGQIGDYVTIPVGDGRGKRVRKEEHLRDLKESVQNSKLAARRIQDEINKLPEEPEIIEDDVDAPGPQPVKD